MLKITFRAMGCEMAALIDRETSQAEQALSQAPDWFEQWEQSLSRFRPDSELNRLNASAGQWFSVSETLWDVVLAALEAARWTGGLVNPAVLDALEQAGYARSFELLPVYAWTEVGSQPFGGLSLTASPSKDVRRLVRLDQRRRAICLLEGVRLDLGGIAKGWAAQTAAARLSAYGPALVDAGGDLAASGPTASGKPWPVAVADPLGMQDQLAMLALSGGGVATSGIDYRRWMKDGVWKHHMIDPRTGQPADTDLLCVTVLAADALRAEAAAKVVMILGSLAGSDWLMGQPDLRGLLVLRDGRLIDGPGLRESLWRDE